MASAKRIQCWLLLLLFLCLMGCMEAIRKPPRSALLFDSLTDDENGNGTPLPGVGESQSLLKQDMDREGRILLASGNDMISSTMDYSPPGSNHDHDPWRGGGHHPHANGDGERN